MGITSGLNFEDTLLHAERAERLTSGRATIKANPFALMGRNALALLHPLRDRIFNLLARPRITARMQLVERVTLAPRHQLVLVEIDGERCLLTLSPHAGIGFHALGARRLDCAQTAEELRG